MISAMNVWRLLNPGYAPPKEPTAPPAGASPLGRDHLVVRRRDTDGNRRLDSEEFGHDRARRHTRFDRNGDGLVSAGELTTSRQVRSSLREVREARQAVRALRQSLAPATPPATTHGAPPAAEAPRPPSPPTFGYTLNYGHTAAELASQFATETHVLMAINGWASADTHVPAGSVIQLPDTPETRALAAGYGGILIEPDVVEAPATPPTAPVDAATVLGVPDPNGFFVTQFYHERWNPHGPAGSANCGPASLAMALEAVGLQAPGVTAPENVEHVIDATRAAMGAHIDAAGRVGDAALTNITQVITGARAAGAECAWVTFEGLDAELAAGRPVVAAGNPAVYNGDWQDRGIANSEYDGGHFITITGKDAAGNYLINDPLSNVGSVAISPAQMQAYMAHYGPGSAVAIVNPNGGQPVATPPTTDGLPPMTPTPAATGDTARLLGALTAEGIERVLTRRGSKLAGQGYGTFILQMERTYGVPAAQFLAQAVMESQLGSDNGYAQPGFNIGNIRPGTSWNGPVVNGPYGPFRVYGSREEGIEDYFRLLASPLYAGKSLKDQLYTYAPPSENDSHHYHDQVVRLIAEWTGIQL
jgi:hypothetical protein